MDSFHLHNSHLGSFISMLLNWSIIRCFNVASYDKSSCGSSARSRPAKDCCVRKSCETKSWVSLNNNFSICGIADLLTIRTAKKSKWDKPVWPLNSVWNLHKTLLSLRLKGGSSNSQDTQVWKETRHRQLRYSWSNYTHPNISKLHFCILLVNRVNKIN